MLTQCVTDDNIHVTNGYTRAIVNFNDGFIIKYYSNVMESLIKNAKMKTTNNNDPLTRKSAIESIGFITVKHLKDLQNDIYKWPPSCKISVISLLFRFIKHIVHHIPNFFTDSAITPTENISIKVNKLLNSKIAITLSKHSDKESNRLLPKTIPCPKRNIAIPTRILDNHSIHALPLSKGNTLHLISILYIITLFLSISNLIC